jgi:hypothetical protein
VPSVMLCAVRSADFQFTETDEIEQCSTHAFQRPIDTKTFHMDVAILRMVVRNVAAGPLAEAAAHPSHCHALPCPTVRRWLYSHRTQIANFCNYQHAAFMSQA